jgi:hypothetical protein
VVAPTTPNAQRFGVSRNEYLRRLGTDLKCSAQAFAESCISTGTSI